jgi:hypothetical protein
MNAVLSGTGAEELDTTPFLNCLDRTRLGDGVTHIQVRL